MQTKLSDLSPPVVDTLYGLDRAEPVASPVFLFLVGAPGSGKSSGHARAISSGLLPSYEPGYATINMDILLESLLPFRAASSMAHHYKKKAATREFAHFASIGAYGTHKENLGLFKWYDEAHAELQEADPKTTSRFNRIRRRFAPLLDQEAPDKLIDINEAALDRAIAKRVNIIYETTISLTKKGRANKVDRLMQILAKKGSPYRIVFYHITGSVEEITQRIRARQNHQTPQDPLPFHRYISTKPERVAEYIHKVAEAFAAVAKQYGKVASFEEFTNPMDPGQVPVENRRTTSTRRRQIVGAYAGSNRRPSSELGSSYRVSMRSSSKRRTQKRLSTVRDEEPPPHLIGPGLRRRILLCESHAPLTLPLLQCRRRRRNA